jgi:hypothetical protein
MLARKTIVDQIEITRDNLVQVRLCLLIVDGDTEVNSRYHRTSIPPEGDPAAQMAFVNSHLATMGEEPVAQADIDRIVAFHGLANQ